MLHELKTWPRPYQAVKGGVKTFEVRKFDRPYSVGDRLWLREWDPTSETYSGDSVTADVTYLLQGGNFGLPADMCVMAIRLTPT